MSSRKKKNAENNSNPNDTLKIQEELHESIKKSNSIEELYKDENSLVSITRAFKNATKCKNPLELINISIKYDYVKTLIDLLDYLLPILLDKLKKDKTEDETDELRKVFSHLKILMYTITEFSNYSVNFCIKFHEFEGIRTLISYIDNQELIDYYKQAKDSDFKRMEKIIGGSINSLVNMCRVYDNNITSWKKVNSVEKILKVSEQLKDISDHQITAYIILALISDEEEIKKFPNLKQVIPKIVDFIRKGAEQIKSKINLKRISVMLDENDTESKEICLIGVWHIVELLNALYHMAVNDTIKFDIYDTFKMSDILQNIIFYGNEVEVEVLKKLKYSLKLLYQLCFDSRIAELVSNNQQLQSKIQELSQSKQESCFATTKNCQGIIWLNKKNLNENVKKDLPSNNQTNGKYIMISYNKESREVCLAIKKKLEEKNFKFWIDVESIHGSSLESMAKAVENSECVLICLTEKYKQSNNCRAEAEYAFNLNKPIVPLIMQKNYKPDGWLGIILGSKIYIDFTKYYFDECILRLEKEIVQVKLNENVHTNNTSQTINSNSSTKPSKTKVENWSENEVKKWLEEKQINSFIINSLIPCNGELLMQLYNMEQRAPEFFYSTISSNNQIPIRELGLFTLQLKKLFNN